MTAVGSGIGYDAARMDRTLRKSSNGLAFNRRVREDQLARRRSRRTYAATPISPGDGFDMMRCDW